MAIHVHHLPTEGPIDPKRVLSGAWQSIRTVSLEPGTTEVLPGGDVEYAVYVTGGSGTVAYSAGERAVAEGTGVVLLREAGCEFRAGDAGLDLFVIAVEVVANALAGSK